MNFSRIARSAEKAERRIDAAVAATADRASKALASANAELDRILEELT